ncbi:MFS/sugar transport family protein [Collimonas pratensis]|uniref:MFS/sugar transport family protein n=2 Tax=Oxalobacteraceae TaxID=75682 RepID=A0A127Q8N3_9BURK|nr:MFS/sugar transport family protein [Collimonas pratensis]
MIAALGLAVAFAGLWLPPVATTYLALWLAVMLILTYTAHSMLNIAYLSWGAKLQHSEPHKSGVLLGAAAWREGAGLVGVIIASIAPSIIMLKPRPQIAWAMGWYSLSFSVLLMIAMFTLLRLSPKWQSSSGSHSKLRHNWSAIKANQAFRKLLLPYFFNAVSVAIPATLVIFFIHDRLQAASKTALFLASYFIAATIGLPVWVGLAKKIGVAPSWGIGMVLAILAFSSTAWLGAGDSNKYMIVCIVAGLALGADLALPPVLLAQVIGLNETAASYYGVWTLLGKLALALSGLGLPILAYFGYQPGLAGSAALTLAYAIVPCVCKGMALILLVRSYSSYRKAAS